MQASKHEKEKLRQKREPSQDDRKYADLLEQKRMTDQVNSEVIAQIGVLKDAIQTF